MVMATWWRPGIASRVQGVEQASVGLSSSVAVAPAGLLITVTCCGTPVERPAGRRARRDVESAGGTSVLAFRGTTFGSGEGSGANAGLAAATGDFGELADWAGGGMGLGFSSLPVCSETSGAGG